MILVESDFDDSPLVKHRKHFKNSTQHQVASTSKMSDYREEKLPDQAPINQKILSQLDAIGKRLTVFESKSAFPAKPKATKLTKKKHAASSSLKPSSVEEVDNNMPSLHTLRNDRSIQHQIQIGSGSYQALIKKVRTKKSKVREGGLLIFLLK